MKYVYLIRCEKRSWVETSLKEARKLTTSLKKQGKLARTYRLPVGAFKEVLTYEDIEGIFIENFLAGDFKEVLTYEDIEDIFIENFFNGFCRKAELKYTNKKGGRVSKN